MTRAGCPSLWRPRPAWRSFVAWTQAREDAASLGVCRIATGLVMLGQCANLLRDGAYATIYAHSAQGGLGSLHGALRVFGGATPEHVGVWVGAWALSALLVTVGLWTRASLLVCGYFFHGLIALNHHAGAGYDRVLNLLLLLLFVGGAGRALSCDVVFTRSTAPTWRIVRYLALLHLTLMYLGSGLSKFSAGWVPFGDHSALWWILHNPIWTRSNAMGVDPVFLPATQVLTLLSWVWEVFAPLWWGLFAWATAPSASRSEERPRIVRALRRGCTIAIPLWGLAFHLGIEALLEVGSFGYLTLCLYALVLPPGRWRHLLMRLPWRSTRRER